MKYLNKIIDYASVGLIGLTLFGFNSCDSGGKHRRKVLNEPPVVDITREFSNNGKVKYIVKGVDSDGFVERIEARYNEDEIVVFQGSRYESAKEITRRDNILKVSVYDDDGDNIKEFDKFRVASRGEAVQTIEAILINANAVYKVGFPDRVPFNLDHNMLYVDFVVQERDNPARYSVIRYSDLNEPLEEVMNDERIFNSFSLDANGTVNNLYLYRLPLEEISTRIKKFSEEGYRRRL